MEYSGQHTFFQLNLESQENKLFENALAVYDKDPHDRRQITVQIVGETSTEEAKKRYETLVDGIRSIESDKLPLPDYEEIKAAAAPT